MYTKEHNLFCIKIEIIVIIILLTIKHSEHSMAKNKTNSRILSTVRNVGYTLSNIYNWTKNTINKVKDSKLFKSAWSYALEHPRVTLGAIAASVILGPVGLLVGCGGALVYLIKKKDYDAQKQQVRQMEDFSSKIESSSNPNRLQMDSAGQKQSARTFQSAVDKRDVSDTIYR